MKKIVWIAGATLSGAILFGAGLLVGRQFPAHHFERLQNSSYLYDSTTGHVCQSVPDTSASNDKSAWYFGQGTIPLCNSK